MSSPAAVEFAGRRLHGRRPGHRLDPLLPLVAPLLSGHAEVAVGSRLAVGARVVRGARR